MVEPVRRPMIAVASARRWATRLTRAPGWIAATATLAVLLLLVVQGAAPAAESRPAGPGHHVEGGRGADLVDRLDWLAGCWEGKLSSGAVYEEQWLAPRAGTLVGMARMTRNGQTLSFEFMRIADDEGTLVYAAQPSGRAPTLFRATAVDSGAITFENPEHDFPQRIVYRFTPPADLLARIEGERDGQLRGMEFPLGRVACPGPVQG